MTSRRCAGCAPSTPERACFLAPAGKNRSPATRRSARAARRTGPRFCRPVRGARYGVSGPQPASQRVDTRKKREDARARIGILRIGGPEPASCFARRASQDKSQAGAAGRRRPTAATCRGEVRRQPNASRFAERLGRTRTEAAVKMAGGRREGRRASVWAKTCRTFRTA